MFEMTTMRHGTCEIVRDIYQGGFFRRSPIQIIAKNCSAQKLEEAIESILGTLNSIDECNKKQKNEKRNSWNAHIVVVVVAQTLNTYIHL